LNTAALKTADAKMVSSTWSLKPKQKFSSAVSRNEREAASNTKINRSSHAKKMKTVTVQDA
jgi:hypothetical protein